ncbi:MAG: hypothetical protein ACR2OU_02350 [Thermomicrobiales bacterium]
MLNRELPREIEYIMPGDKETLPFNGPAKQPAQPRSDNGRLAQTGIGAPAFFQYQRALRQDAATHAPVPSRVETGLALLGKAIVIASVFGPWAKYQTNDERVGHISGTSTDANLVIAFSVVAIVSLACVFLRKHAAVTAMIGFVTSLGSFILAGATWTLIDTVYVADTSISGFPTAGWGAITGTIAAFIAAILAFRVMRAARLYE